MKKVLLLIAAIFVTTPSLSMNFQPIENAKEVSAEKRVRKEACKAKGTDKMTPQLKWWKNRPLSITFNFKSGSIVTVLHAGVTPKMTKEDIERNIEVLYVRDVDVDGKMIPLIWKDIDGVKTLIKSKEGGESWHNKYLGQFGYIASGHAAQKDGIAKFYKYSCNLDSGVYETGILTAQVFDENGNLGKLITVEGPAAKPDIHVAY